MYWTAALEIPIGRCILCEYIYALVCMSMHSLHGCDKRCLSFWSRCVYFSVS